MKVSIAYLIASMLLLHSVDYCTGTCGCETTTIPPPQHCTVPPSPCTSTTTTPEPPHCTIPPSPCTSTTTPRSTRPLTTTTPKTTTTTTTTTKTTTTPRPTQPPPTKGPWTPCQPCGPGGRACTGCKGQPDLCKDLLDKLKALDKQIKQCVCAENVWLL